MSDRRSPPPTEANPDIQVDTETGEIRDRDDGARPRQLSHEDFDGLARAPHLWEVTETVSRRRMVLARGPREAVEMFERLEGIVETPVAKRAVSVSDKGPAER
jgi:hypothetical protein